MRSLLAALAALALAPAAAQAATPLEAPALWTAAPAAGIAPTQLAAEAQAAGARVVFVKAADGSTAEAGFTSALVSALRAQGISVCGWVFAYGAAPDAEAAAAVAAARAGAQCLVVDAESQYESRYGAAQRYVHDLRGALGARFPIGLASQAEVLEHQKFPYSVFLGPGGFGVDEPQLYWHELGLTVPAAFAVAFGQNEWYGRPLAPIGQLFDGVSQPEVASFEGEAAAAGARGYSLFDLEAARAAAMPGPLIAPSRIRHSVPPPAALRPGADGDEVLWAQEHLDAAGARLPLGGYYGAATSAAVARFQRARRLPGTGLLDARSWKALLRIRPRTPSWAAAPPLFAR